MPLRENELVRRDAGGLEVRSDPLRVKWEFHDLVTSDGHELRCIFTGSVRALPDRTERLALQELLLDGRTALFAEDIARHFHPALRGAAARIAQSHEAKQWIESDIPRRELIDAFKAAALPVAFACGLEVLPPFQADFQSPTFERQRVRAMQQALIEKEAAGQVERLQRVGELLKQFQSLRASAPELSASQVLERIDSTDRGSLMQALLMAGARQNSAALLWTVAGPYIVRVDASQPLDGRTPPRMDLFPLPPLLGPLRSVTTEEVDGKSALLVGAQRGFLLVRGNDCSDVVAYHDPGLASPLGFNRVVYWSSRRQFCATHSEGGIVCWDADTPDSPVKIMRPAALGVFPTTTPDVSTMTVSSMSIRGSGSLMGPRNLRRLNPDLLIFSSGGRVMTWDGNSAKTAAEASPAEVCALISDERNIQAIHDDGMVCTLDPRGDIVSSQRRFGRVRTAASLPWIGGSRALLAADDGPVQSVGFDDPLITQYVSSYRGVRVLAGSAAMVAAVSPDRQRLVLWNSWDGRQPAAELFIAAQARHRIADISFA